MKTTGNKRFRTTVVVEEQRIKHPRSQREVMEIPQTVAMHKGRDFEDWFAKSILMDMFSMQLKIKIY